jgi:hypothetical protein
MALVDRRSILRDYFGGGNAPSHGRHQMGVNSGLQWDSVNDQIRKPADEALSKAVILISENWNSRRLLAIFSLGGGGNSGDFHFPEQQCHGA